MTALLLVVLAWAPKNTDVHAKDLASQPTRTHSTHFEKLGGAITITLPKIYVPAPYSGDVSKTKPIPAEACEEGLCSLSFHAETLALPTFSIRSASMPKAGSTNFGHGEWKCADGRCVAEYRKVGGCCAATEIAVAREVSKGKALICVGSMDVPRSDDSPTVVEWITSVCDGIVFKPDAK
ncbi:MAG: hypothetical protein QM817_41875 [Archangium sp.]